jgi:hypothetical protein
MGITPKEVIYNKPGRGGTPQKYVQGTWFVGEANALFNFLWSQRIIEHKYYEERSHIVALVEVSIHIPGKTIVTNYPDGRIETTRIEPITLVKQQFGGADVKKWTKDTKTAKKGDLMDLADDLKAAATDGMKKCFSLFGFARDVYGPREKEELESESVDGPDPTYTKILARAAKLGWDEAKTHEWMESTSSKKLADITPTDFVDLLRVFAKIPSEIQK